MENVILSQIPLDLLIAQLRIVIKEEIQAEQKRTEQPKYLTSSEVLAKLRISRGTLHNYTKQGLLVRHKVGGKTVYDSQEVDSSVKQIKRFRSQL